MIATLGYCLRDQEIALELAHWIRELGGCPSHELFLIHDRRCDPALCSKVLDAFIPSFKAVYPGEAPAEIDGWPEGANYFLRIISCGLQNKPYGQFLWLEPDSIPLTAGWMDQLEKEYFACNKLFMGDRVEVGDIPLHMSGVGIYPNPLHRYAGEAYRAHEIAWDMAAKDQIVPAAHWTKLIEHAWKHPPFTDRSELTTQIRHEAVLFHASKDGSLIRLLREKFFGKTEEQIFPAVPVLTESQRTPQKSASATAERGGEARESTNVKPADLGGQDSRGGREIPACDIFIRTYPEDYGWLRYCLKAIDKFASGFRKVWIISPQECPFDPVIHNRAAEWRVINPETEDGYLDQQITKLYADMLTDHSANFYLHIDSDVILTRPVTPQDFFDGGPSISPAGEPYWSERKLIWPYTPYSAIETPWQAITEKFLGHPVENEFMRRLPIMVPYWLYPKLREFCFKRHGMPMCDYIRMQPDRSFSEFNALGAYAYTYHHDKFLWLNTLESAIPGPFARQFHSWGGITPGIRTEIETILSGGNPERAVTVGDGSQPFQAGEVEVVPTTKENVPSAQKTLHGTEKGCALGSGPACPQSSEPEHSVPSQIKILPSDIWVLKGDQISQWVEQEGRLDHDQNFLPKILPHIKEGDTVLDIGAFIGDHTVAYSRAVGVEGRVIAFEPNPVAAQCLLHNTNNLDNVYVIEAALTDCDDDEVLPLSGNNGNWGGAYIGTHMKIADVRMQRVDWWEWRPNLIKIDVEGYELKVLRGAEQTIERHRPKLVLEMNSVALQRQGADYTQIFEWLQDHHYDWDIMQENCFVDSPMYDILCLPSTLESKDVAEQSAGESINGHVRALADYSKGGVERMKYVRKLLRRHGVITKRRLPASHKATQDSI
jgi:FkbM family methyltransferase